jgi:hypothetical protein
MATSLNSKLKPPWQLILAEENATDFVEHVNSRTRSIYGLVNIKSIES